jgi:membrane-associated phospholipid phosphatase
MHTLARSVSIVLHPFVTTLALAWSIESRLGSVAALRTVLTVAALFILPLVLLTARQVRYGRWTTVDASHPGERPALFWVGGIGLLLLLAFFIATRPDTPLVTGTAGVLAMLAVCAGLTRWVKVSLHMAAAAMAAFVLIPLGLPVGWILAAMLPLLAWSRVALERHSWSEVALGTAIGATTGLLIGRFG